MKKLKRILSAFLSVTMLIPMSFQMASAENEAQFAVPKVSYVLEAEDSEGVLDSNVKYDELASGNRYLCAYQKDSLKFKVPSNLKEGNYTVIVTAKHPYGYKENYVNLNGKRIGTIVGSLYTWEDYTFSNQTVNPNDEIEIELYWGWFDVDSVKLISEETSSALISSYKIEAEKMALGNSYDIYEGSSASNGKFVRAYQYTDFNFNIPQNFKEGRYDITVVAKHPFGYKCNYISINQKKNRANFRRY